MVSVSDMVYPFLFIRGVIYVNCSEYYLTDGLPSEVQFS